MPDFKQWKRSLVTLSHIDWDQPINMYHGINRNKNGKLLQQCTTRIDAVFCPFFGWNLEQSKNYQIHFLSLLTKNRYFDYWWVILRSEIPESMFVCSFTGNVKLKGIIVIGGEEGSHPNKMRLWVKTPTYWYSGIILICESVVIGNRNLNVQVCSFITTSLCNNKSFVRNIDLSWSVMIPQCVIPWSASSDIIKYMYLNLVLNVFTGLKMPEKWHLMM